MAEAKDILDKVKNLKSNSDSMALKKMKGTVSGAMIGVGGGLLIGFTRGYNLVTSAFVGALVGGLISQLLLPKMDDNGDPTVCKTKRPNGRQFKEERKSIETFQEYYIEDMEAIDMILTTMCVNGSTFDYKSFMTEKA